MCDDKYTVLFTYAIFERVRIYGSGADGVVTGRSQCLNNMVEYRVLAYFNGQRSEAWYYEHELERI